MKGSIRRKPPTIRMANPTNRSMPLQATAIPTTAIPKPRVPRSVRAEATRLTIGYPVKSFRAPPLP